MPKSYYSGSLSLGASHDETITRVMIPAARSGIFAGIILGIGRAIGETMAVILVAGNQTRLTLNLSRELEL
ncbi:Phosphate transport system permease protein pstC [Peptoniphilus harei]|uniref:Phosphate transport system permease protein pstC n=1 Tax=Peptoniphilus harei TaxID=54005 RepID=A0A2X1WZL0_9FIRM|nr:Phosphate transport system permease protein pstC [Peptoniphilus harei]